MENTENTKDTKDTKESEPKRCANCGAVVVRNWGHEDLPLCSKWCWRDLYGE